MDKNNLTVDEIMKQFEEYKTSKENEIGELRSQLEQEKLKNAQFTITGVTKKVEPSKVEVKEEVDFKFEY